MITLSSSEFSRDINKAKHAADSETVIITDQDKPTYVLLSYAAYLKLAAHAPSIVDLLYTKGASDIEFDPPRLGTGIFKPVEFD